MMNVRKVVLIVVTMLIASAALIGVASALDGDGGVSVARLENVRAYAPALDGDGINYVVDGGELRSGRPGDWSRVATPNDVIVSAVAQDPGRDSLIYIGAANELAIYRSSDMGASWQRVPLETDSVGSVTDLAVDSANRLVYVGTDTDGVHRLRDVGSSLIASAHLLLDEAVEEVATATNGEGLAFVRTRWNLYRAEEMGLRWVQVDNLPSPATAVAVASTTPPTVYVGTASTGLRASDDGGRTWRSVNAGLGYAPGTHLYVHDVAVDPAEPEVVYVSTSAGFGSTNLHMTPMGVALSRDGSALFETLAEAQVVTTRAGDTVPVAVTDLMPVSGQPGALFALTAGERSPIALGSAEFAEPATVIAGDEAEQSSGPGLLTLAAWILAGLAGLGLLAVVWMDLMGSRRSRRGGDHGTDPLPRRMGSGG